MTTQADKARDSALNYINSAIKEISKIVVDEIDGYYDYGSNYRNELNESLTELIKIREKIGLKD